MNAAMEVTATNSDGLKHELTIQIPHTRIDEAVTKRLKQLGKTVRLPGFRPGKVPIKLLRQRFETSVMGEVLEAVVDETSTEALTSKGLKPAMQPKIEVKTFEKNKDLEYTVSVEVLPEIEPTDISKLELERPLVEPGEAQIETILADIANRHATDTPLDEPRPAAEGDVVVIDFAGTVDGEARDGMQGEGHKLKLGSGSFIPGFEEQLVGAEGGETRTVTVTFPEAYHEESLAGKEAKFEVTVTEVRAVTVPEMDDELAQKMGQDSVEDLRNAVKEQAARELGQLARQRVKRKLLDALAEQHDFPVPAGMVDMEFQQIWQGVEREKERGGLTEEEMAKDEDTLKADYRAIAERRVRLGLLLTEIGKRAELTISDEEMTRALIMEAQKYPGQERQVMEYFRDNRQALEGLRAPIYEDKVVDYILEMAQVTDQPMTVEELTKALEEDV